MRKLLIISLILFSLNAFAQSRYISQTTKKIVYSRDGGACQCCGDYEYLEYDHISPYSCGGSNDVSNIQIYIYKISDDIETLRYLCDLRVTSPKA